jgi:hypothetical protein
MSSSLLRATIGGAFVVLTACSSDGTAASATPPPAPETLFDAASPNVLRGVWGNTQEQPNGTIEIRLRFIDKYLVGGAKCTPKGGGASVIAGGSIALNTEALDAATGKLTIGTLGFQKQEGQLLCQVSLPANTYDFTVAETTLTLAVGAAKVSPSFEKIGD